MAWLFHYTGEGRGLYSGVTEYVVISEDAPDCPYDSEEDDAPKTVADSHCAPGFTLGSATNLDTDEVPVTVPMNRSLKPF